MPKMRKTTRRKILGRDQLIVGLRGAMQTLTKVLDSNDPAVLRAAAGAAIGYLRRAGEGMDIYGLDRKRVRAALERVISLLETLMGDAAAIAITPEEKALRAHARPRLVTARPPVAAGPPPSKTPGRRAAAPKKRPAPPTKGAKPRPARAVTGGKKRRRRAVATRKRALAGSRR